MNNTNDCDKGHLIKQATPNKKVNINFTEISTLIKSAKPSPLDGLLDYLSAHSEAFQNISRQTKQYQEIFNSVPSRNYKGLLDQISEFQNITRQFDFNSVFNRDYICTPTKEISQKTPVIIDVTPNDELDTKQKDSDTNHKYIKQAKKLKKENNELKKENSQLRAQIMAQTAVIIEFANNIRQNTALAIEAKTQDTIQISQHQAELQAKDEQITTLQQQLQEAQARIKELESTQNADVNNELKGLQKVNYDTERTRKFAQIIAKAIWDMDKGEAIRTKDMVQFLKPLILKFESTKLPDNDDTVSGWLADVKPPHATQAGRPPKNEPLEIPLTFKK